jgi:hypothetical protein
MVATPAGAARVCRRIAVLATLCPERVPDSRYGVAGRPVGLRGPYAAGGYSVCLAPRRHGECTAAVFQLEGGIPSGDARRDSPPRFVHLALYAARGNLDRYLPFELPCRGPVVGALQADRLLVAPRESAACLGRAKLGGHPGILALVPPFPAGGEAGGHLLFLWEEPDASYAATLHAWKPVAETVDVLAEVAASAPPG